MLRISLRHWLLTLLVALVLHALVFIAWRESRDEPIEVPAVGMEIRLTATAGDPQADPLEEIPIPEEPEPEPEPEPEKEVEEKEEPTEESGSSKGIFALGGAYLLALIPFLFMRRRLVSYN